MPTIVSTTPQANTTEVYTGTNIDIVFDSDMDAASITASTFVVYDQDFTIFAGSISYNALNKTATFVPAFPFLVRTTITVVIQGGVNGIRTIPDINNNIFFLSSNYSFSFITNDGRFLTPPIDLPPSGVPSDVIYPSGIRFSTPFLVGHTSPSNRQARLDPTSVYLDVSGNPTITVCFNKPVNLDSLNGAGEFCMARPASVTGEDILQDPFVPFVDYTPSGSWSAVQWQAKFTFDNNVMLRPNEEITITIPSTVSAQDTTQLGEDFVFYFTTKMDPLYIGPQAVRLQIGNLIADIPDDTIDRLIYSNSKLANWYSRERPALIKPFLSARVLLTGITTVRPAFAIDPVKGAPEYVKRYVLAKTMLDLLKARYQQYLDGILLGGGPGASKMLDDLRVSEGVGSLYAATVGPLIDELEGNKKEKIQGSVNFWLSYITGDARWRSAIRANWGQFDPRMPPRRGEFMGNKGMGLLPGAPGSGPGDSWGIPTPEVGVRQMPYRGI